MTTFSYIEEKDLKSTVLDTLIAASALRNSTEIDDAFLMSGLIRNLHKYRFHFPQQNRLLSKAIFKIHDIAYYGKSEIMRQQASNAMLTGFVQNPTEDMTVLKEVLNRMPLVKDPKEVLTTFKILGNHILQTYTKQNYQENDANSTIAYRLKALLQMVSDSAKNRADKEWVKNNATILENTDPKFKGFSTYFTVPQSKVYLPPADAGLEAVVICAHPKLARSGFFSHNYD